MGNIKNTWKGIKSIIPIKNTSSDFPKCLPTNVSVLHSLIKLKY